MSNEVRLPEMGIIKQRFDRTKVEDIEGTIRAELDRIKIASKIEPGQKIAITAGSRGISNIALIIRATVNYLKERRAQPFIFPAMGSHGGATADGQLKVLAQLGVTEESVGCPIISSMKTKEIGKTEDGIPVVVDKECLNADHIIVLNRVKPHTKFEGPIESGLMKMLAIGMGKQKGADLYHSASLNLGMNRVVETVGLVVMEKCPILCGIGIVENGYDETAIIRALLPDELIEGEKKLLVEAKKRMAKLPFKEIDLLIVDEMGKNISGTGMDTNITGVNRDILGDFTSEPRVKRLFVRDLTPETEGNALGIGLAHFTTRRLVEKIDIRKTYMNALTAKSPEKASIPVYLDTDEECIFTALDTTMGLIPFEKAKIVHIKNTLELEYISASRVYEEEIAKRDDLELVSDWKPISFNEEGNLISPFSQVPSYEKE